MFSLFPKLFRTNKKRVNKAESMDSLDRSTVKSDKPQVTGYAHLFKQDNHGKQAKAGVSPLHPNAHTIRMRGI